MKNAGLTRKLKLMPYAQAEVHIYPDTETRCLISYRTLAAELTDDGWLYVPCMCSPTTRRHVTAFLKEYAPRLQNPYYIAKDLNKRHMCMNIHTGEVKDY